MKSKRAQKELEKLENFYPFSGWIAPSDTYRIAEIAEQEAEERMRKKAAEAYCRDCCCTVVGKCGMGLENCEALRYFIQKLNENEKDKTSR
jgi:hypothetical protein